jgi:alcohol dehydrogenase
VQVRAASVNPVDFKIRDGKVKALIKDRFPLIMGNDLSGVVVESRSSKFRAGDEIFARLDKDRIGAFAEFALVRESAAAMKPARLSHEEAASIPLVGLTAWQAMVDIGRVQQGQHVLIHAGSGGVGTFAIQLAKHLGAWVATTVGARNVELVKRLGADVAIDYRAQQFDEVLEDMDFALDTQGGESLHRTFPVMARGGCIVSIGAIPDAKFARAWGVNPLLIPALALMTRKETKLSRQLGVRYEYLFMRADGAELARIAELLDAGIIKPILDKTFPLDQVREALAYSESGRATGKVVITVA